MGCRQTNIQAIVSYSTVSDREEAFKRIDSPPSLFRSTINHMDSDEETKNLVEKCLNNSEYKRGILQIYNKLGNDLKRRYYDESSFPKAEEDISKSIISYILACSFEGELRGHIGQIGSKSNVDDDNMIGKGKQNKVLIMEARLRRAIKDYNYFFPRKIWTCCSRCCFAYLASNPDEYNTFNHVLSIKEMLIEQEKEIAGTVELLTTRRKAVGGSSLTFSAPLREQREEEVNMDSCKMRCARVTAEIIENALPFLRGKQNGRNGCPIPSVSLCMEAITLILGLSKNYLYHRCRGDKRSLSASSGLDVVKSMVDGSGIRMREHRRMGLRTGFPAISEMCKLKCACIEPCLSGVSEIRLNKMFKEFSELSSGLEPRKMENRYLLNIMLCPLMNTTVKVCNKALSNLFTISENRIADIRRILKKMCSKIDIDQRTIIEEQSCGYKYSARHPMNRYPQEVRDKVETHLDLILRAEPGADEDLEENTCRLYSPKINTYEKLRNHINNELKNEGIIEESISPTTVQRMIKEYLKEKNCRISFTQSDHNACPTCKSAQYAILQCSFDKKRW